MFLSTYISQNYLKNIFLVPIFWGSLKKLLSYTLLVPMMDGPHLPHRSQEHRSSAHWSIGTSGRAIVAGATTRLTTAHISGGGAF
jgi:hypothetical protein